MNLAEIRELVAAGGINQPLPRYVTRKCLILSLTSSQCCKAKELLVRSRDGGFVTRDCLNCGARADYVRQHEIPDLDCEGCLKLGRPNTIEPMMKERNYWYRCTACGREWKIAEIVPIWDEAFEYSGLAAPGDPAYRV